MSSPVSLLNPGTQNKAGLVSGGTVQNAGTTGSTPTVSGATVAPAGGDTSSIGGGTRAEPTVTVDQYENRPLGYTNVTWVKGHNPNDVQDAIGFIPPAQMASYTVVPLPYGTPPGGVLVSDGGVTKYQPPPPPDLGKGNKYDLAAYYVNNKSQTVLTPNQYADYSKAPPVIQQLVASGKINPGNAGQQWSAYAMNTESLPRASLPGANVQGVYTATGQADNEGTPTYVQNTTVDPGTGKSSPTGTGTGTGTGSGTQDPNAANNFNTDEAAAYQAALTALAAKAQDVSLDTTQADADRTSWLQSINSIQQIANGNLGEHDPAAIALRQAGQGALRNLQASAATAAASSSPNLAFNGLLSANGALQSQLAQAGALQQATEIQTAQQALPGLFANLNSQDIATASTAAGVKLQGIQSAGSILSGSAAVGQNAANAAQQASDAANQMVIQLKALGLQQEQIDNALTEFWAGYTQHASEFSAQLAAGNTAGIISALSSITGGIISSYTGVKSGSSGKQGLPTATQTPGPGSTSAPGSGSPSALAGTLPGSSTGLSASPSSIAQTPGLFPSSVPSPTGSNNTPVGGV